MNVGLAIAGLICVAMAMGHARIGLVWVLPRIAEALPGITEQGGPHAPFASMTEGMVRVSWHIITIFAASSGGLFLSLASFPAADPKALTLRWCAAMWVVAAAMALWVAGPRSLLRLPVPLLWVVVAVLCWRASR